MEDLLKALYYLYESDSETIVEDDGEYFKPNNELADTVEELACSNLITESGQCDYSAINILKKSGYDVYPGDQDSFGWLTGCIQKHGDKRILVYG